MARRSWSFGDIGITKLELGNEAVKDTAYIALTLHLDATFWSGDEELKAGTRRPRPCTRLDV